ncbi:hypothetical protein Tco_1121290 [Tanacetum coccineum]|uniref:Uncharacterized protein n=1 Tax=Tanacetum coccineum TaxID=301880 RepID=A0ABQ5IX96_9ASTR
MVFLGLIRFLCLCDACFIKSLFFAKMHVLLLSLLLLVRLMNLGCEVMAFSVIFELIKGECGDVHCLSYLVRSPTTSVPAASPIPRALSHVHANLLPPCKRIMDFDSVTNFEVSSEEGYVPYVPREGWVGVMLRFNHPDVLDDTAEPVREDLPELVSIVDL